MNYLLLLKIASLLHGSKVQISVLLLLGVEETTVRTLGKRPKPLLRWGRGRWRRGWTPHAPIVAKVATKVVARSVARPKVGRRVATRVAAAARVGVLLLQRPLLDVVGELGGGHAVRLLAVRLELRRSELGLQLNL